MASYSTALTRLLTALVTALLLLLSLGARAQLQLTGPASVTQDFNSLGSSATAALPAGFQLAGGTSPVYGDATNTTATTQAGGTSGTGALSSTSTGGAYNFASGVTATSPDRALGFLTSSGYASPRSILLAVGNATRETLTDLRVTFDIEKFRTGTRAFDWQFFTSADGTTWSGPLAEGSQSYAADGATAVVNPPTATAKSVTLSGLNLADGGTLYLRWYYVGMGGSTNAQGLGLDNVVLTPTLSGAAATPTITTGPITGSPFCATGSTGAAVSVPFAVTGGLSGTFAAQLSDAAGAFASDLTQNLIGTGSTSPLLATIPAGTAAGAGYRVRVVHAASATTDSPNAANLTISNPPASNAVTVTPAAAQSLTTTGTGTMLTATAAAPSAFTWRHSTSSTGPFTTAISGATAPTYTPKGSDFTGGGGTYYLVAQGTSTCGAVVGTSAPITITVTAPQPTVTATPNPIPDFGSVAVNSASGSKTVSLSGSSLPGSDVTLTPPAGFQLRSGTTGAFSCAPLTLPVAGGSFSATVEVRFVPAQAQAYAVLIAVTSPGTMGLTGIQVSGTGTSPAYPPSLRTTPATAVTPTTATAGGEVLEDGGSAITARGVAYATTPAPTTQDEFTQDGSGVGSFTSSLSGLLPNTTYFARAYATNAQGTSYGEQQSFTTASVALALEPTQGSTLTAPTVTPTSATLSVSGGNGAKRLLLVTPGPALTLVPTDGTTYAASSTYGQGDQPAPSTYVVLAGAATSVMVTGLRPDTEYTFAVYDYHDDNTSGAENYLATPRGELTLSTPPLPLGLLLSEDFDYAANDLLTQRGWTAHSVPGTNPVRVASSGLSYASYAATAGNAAALTATGEDVSRTFSPQTAGSAVYAALLVNVSSVAGTPDYFFHLSSSPVASTFRARLFVRAAATSGKMQFGVSGSGTTTQYDPTEYNLNQTYLLLVRYTFGPGGTETRLYVNPEGVSEPATASATSTEAASSAPDNIAAVALRQGANTSPLLLDGLRVANSYAAARAFATPGGPLPVTLTRFGARRQLAGGGVLVSWATAQEKDALAFHVQRSLDGRRFHTVLSQAAAGTSGQARQYQALDGAAPAAALYYRLEQEDTDGTRHYSGVVVVAAGSNAAVPAAVLIAPNPVNAGQKLLLTVTGRAEQALTLRVFDNAGRLHYTQALHPTTDNEQLPLTLPATLPAGTYQLQLSSPGSAPLRGRLQYLR